MKHIVAVDGGASRCRLAAFSAGGELLARTVVDDHASLTLGSAAAWQHISRGLRSLAAKLNKDTHWRPDMLSMGLAGTLQEQNRKEFIALLPSDIPFMLHTDGYAQLMGAAGAQPGICLAVGTGSVVHWLDTDGQHGMAGGWGFPVGDQGSGAWIGMRLLQQYIAYRDGNRSQSPLMVELEQRTGSSVSDVQRWTTESRSGNLAQLAPLVFEAAAAGDSMALNLLEEAVRHCIGLVNHAPQSLPVYVVGGVGTQLSAALSKELENRLQPGKGDALRGLWHLAKRGQSV